MRILSEQEAVKLLLSMAGRRPYGGRSSAGFNQGKSTWYPIGGKHAQNINRNWNMNSPVWIGINRAGSDDMVDSFDGGWNRAFDVDSGICDASRIVIDEVYKVTNIMGLSDSLGEATCLATVGEALLWSRQPRDAMLRLAEAVSIYRGLLGPYHVHALHSMAKALTKSGETRVALLEFAHASRIFVVQRTPLPTPRPWLHCLSTLATFARLNPCLKRWFP